MTEAPRPKSSSCLSDRRAKVNPRGKRTHYDHVKATEPQFINEICADIPEGYLYESGKNPSDKNTRFKIIGSSTGIFADAPSSDLGRISCSTSSISDVTNHQMMVPCRNKASANRRMHASRFTSGKNNWTPTKSDFSRRDYSSCFGGSSYHTEMAITAILRFTGLPVR